VTIRVLIHGFGCKSLGGQTLSLVAKNLVVWNPVLSHVARNRGAPSHALSHAAKSHVVLTPHERNRVGIRRRAVAAMSRKCGAANPDHST